MPFEFKKDQGVTIAVLTGTLDKTHGEEFAAQVEREIPKGDPLIVDGSDLKTLTQQGVLHLITAQRWASLPDRKRLPLVGFNSTVWRAIVENGSDFFFDSKATLPEAMQSFSLSASPPRPAPVAPPPPPPAYSDVTVAETVIGPTLIPERPRTPPRPAAKPEPWLQPATGIPVPAPFQEPTPPPAPAAPAYAAPVFTPSPFAPPVLPPPRSKAPLWAGLALALLLVLGAGGWWFFAPHPPSLTLSAPSTVVEEDGKEPDELTAQVSHGRLEEKSWSTGLPNGLYFDSASEDSGTRTYTLRGKAAPGSTPSTVQLVAVGDDGKQRSAPVPFMVTVKSKPMTWQLTTLQSIHLKAGQHIWATSKFLVNASNVATGSSLPPGVAVERVPGKEKDWQLAGTPTTAGSYPVTFTATSPDGKTDAQTCTLTVAEGEAEAPKAVVASVSTPAAASTPAPPAASDLDDGMRRFLLERIENLPSTYSDQEREKLREMVGTLRKARLIHRVIFEREGQATLSPEQAGGLRNALGAPDAAGLIKDPACQIVVVGYASRSGSLASNVRLSKLRARNVNDALRGAVGRNADLCGDYGPTDVVDQGADEKNRAVEVYAGILEPSVDMQSRAALFKQKFNREHGLR